VYAFAGDTAHFSAEASAVSFEVVATAISRYVSDSGGFCRANAWLRDTKAASEALRPTIFFIYLFIFYNFADVDHCVRGIDKKACEIGSL
jgi:hypothetical protein